MNILLSIKWNGFFEEVIETALGGLICLHDKCVGIQLNNIEMGGGISSSNIMPMIKIYLQPGQNSTSLEFKHSNKPSLYGLLKGTTLQSAVY